MLGVTIIFYVATMILGALAMFNSSRNTYLTAKNDMIEHDLERVCFYTSTTFGYSWFFDYAKDHTKEIRESLESDLMNSAPAAPQFSSEEVAVMYYTSLSPDEQLKAAVQYFYVPLMAEMNFESTHFDYGGLFCIDIRDTSRSILYYNAGKLDDNFNLKVEGNNIDDSWEFDIDKHPAVQKLRSGDYNKAAFELAPSDWAGDGYYYIGYMPMIYNNEIKAVFAIDYNWEGFHTQLSNEIRIVIGIMFLAMVISCALLMLVINRIAIKPLSTVQHTVRNYIKDKDSSVAEKQLEKVKSTN